MAKVLKLRSKTRGSRFQPVDVRCMRSVSFRARSFDPAKRTFTFVLASETPCRTYRLDRNWNLVEVDEVLPMSALLTLKMERGWPLLNAHNSRDARDILGRITALRIEGTELVADARLSRRDDVAGIVKDMEDGILCEFSVGFDILEDGDVEERAGDVPLIRVKSWAVREGSPVPLPADSTAVMRGAHAATRTLSQKPNQGTRAMTAEELEAKLTDIFATATASIVDLVTDATEEDEGDDPDAEAEAAAERARAAVLAKRGKTGATTAATPASEAAAKLAIRTACKRNGREADYVDMEKSGASLAELRSLVTSTTRTSQVEIDTSTKPGAGGKRGLIRLEDTPAGKRKAK